MKPVKRTIQANSKGEDGRFACLTLRLPRFLNVTRGSVLIVTMWIVLVLASLVLVFSRSMRVEAIASANYVSAVQADAIARGALQYVQAKILTEEEETLLLESKDVYEAVEVQGGFFWIVHPNLSDDRNYTFGVTDEASKINLNSATQEMLLKLPGMTSELASSIIDWRDEDTEITPGGAESEYYLLLPEAYYCKDAPFETVEEVLLVRGATADILYGEDTNKNGVLDPQENDAEQSEPPDNRNGRLDRGIYDYVTVYSRQPNVTEEGEDRINVNSGNTGEISDLLRETIKDDTYFQYMDRIRQGRPFRNIIDFYYRVGLTAEQFKTIVGRLTTSSDKVLAGLVNINTAPREVLLCLPELTESDADALISKRLSLDETELGTVAWIIDVIDQEKAVAIGGHITTQSFQKSVDIVSVSRNGRAYGRYQAVLDLQNETPKILYWKSLHHLGWPLDSKTLLNLRTGNSPN
ncbi:MAG: general secretion pathway protein GspK [Sedimentisphaerales bacterium]|nr:general secretion pathway protein GspK [Sedimentisphaerales bacterium]